MSDPTETSELSPQAKFDRLTAAWQQETMFSSNLMDAMTHRAYQQIIGMGPTALPLILRSLEQEPHWWFWALTAITCEDPAEGETTLDGARARWLEWGREHGYLEETA